MLTCFEKSFVVINWNDDKKIVELTWKGFASSEEYREAQLQALDVIKEKKSKLMLMDARTIKVIMPEDQAWALDVWGPKFAMTGAKKLAAVIPESAVARMNANSMEKKMDPNQAATPFDYQSFGSVLEAQDWLIRN
jgi:hypothetical protein